MAQIRALAGASGTGSEEERPAVVVRTGQRGMLPERRQDPMQVRSLADMVHRQLDLQPVAAEQPAGEQILLAEVPGRARPPDSRPAGICRERRPACLGAGRGGSP